MSEYLRAFGSDDHEPSAEQQAYHLLSSDETLMLESNQTLRDAVEVQQFLDAQIYLTEEKLLQSTHSVVSLLNKAAKNQELIGQPAAIITSNPSKVSPDQDRAIYEGSFLGFAVYAVEVPNPYGDSQSSQTMYQPRLHLQIEENDFNHSPRFRSGDILTSSLIFTGRTQPLPVDLQANRWNTPIEKVAVEHFNLFNQELAKPLAPSSIQKAAAIGFYLLNKSAFANATEFEDKLIDTANFHMPLNHKCDIEVDFYLEAGSSDGQLDYNFVHQPKQTIQLKQVDIQTVSCLPRSYLRASKYTNEEIILNRQQKSLYFSLITGDQTHHIPLEAVRNINLSGEIND